MTLWIMSLLFAGLLFLGTPLYVAMGLSAVIALAIEGQVPLLLLPQQFFVALDNFALLAVPLFILAGELMNAAGITERFVALCRALLGHLRAGLAQASVLTNMFMAAISGSAAADLAAVGSMMIPAMKQEGYRKDFIVAVMSCAAMLGPIIPPSLVAVIYGSITGDSVGALFLAGAVPGVLLGVSMMVLTALMADRVGGIRHPRASFTEVVSTARSAGAALVMPVIIIGGILSGVFTPTEAGGVAVVYGLLYGAVLRRFRFAALYEMTLQASATTASALITLGGAGVFGWVLSRTGFARDVLETVLTLTSDPTFALLLVLAALFVVGTFLEPVPAMIISVPVLQPIIKHFGLDPIHVGILVIMTLVLGAVTPPVGLLAMIACRMVGIEFSKSFKMLMPFIGVWVVVILMIVFFPGIALWLPRFVYG
jgi:C4-dicarboxylate transporter DctM subunit